MAKAVIDREGISRSVEQEFVARKFARLVKLMDMEDARRLIWICLRFPDEAEKDLSVIEKAAIAESHDMVRDLLHWYEAKNMVLLSGCREQGLLPQDRHQLTIFKRFSDKPATHESSAPARSDTVLDGFDF